jgi:hypothetical protein
MTVAFLDRLASALGATLFMELRWHGEQLDRLMDRSHAALEEMTVQGLRAANWITEVEVCFNWYGDRGRCDAVAWDSRTRTLLIVEAKTRLGPSKTYWAAWTSMSGSGSRLLVRSGGQTPCE